MEPIFPNTLPLSKARNNKHFDPQFNLTQFTDRVLKALQDPLLLLYRSDPKFYVLGATGNVYIVNISNTLTCTCPDRAIRCKHILFVLVKVLGVCLDDPCLKRRTLKPCQQTKILSNSTSQESLAGHSLRERFHQMFLLQKELGGPGHAPCTDVEEGSTCPICLEEMGKSGDRLVACGTCRNPVHEECLFNWTRTGRTRSMSCVICRSKWTNKGDQERYFNMAAYISEDDGATQTSAGTSCHT